MKRTYSFASISRRNFILGAGATAASAQISRAFGSPAQTASSRERLHTFDYADVQLTGGPLKDQFDRVHASYLALDNDRLLKVYRQRAGLPAPGQDMGGWYDANGFVPGHSLGQYISGLSRYARSTGDPAATAKVRALVRGYSATLGPENYPYASKVASTTWPCYILDKYEIGLLDAYNLAGVREARELLPRVIEGALPYIPDHGYDRGPKSPKQAPYDETYILPENLFNSYALTGNRQYLDLARKYLLNAEFFAPLAQSQNVLPGEHAYSHVIALSSAAKAYLVLGDSQHLEAIQHAWDMLVATQQYASGGWGPKEKFVQPHTGQLYDSLNATTDHFETPCGCYAQMKLARYLLRFTGESRYGDGLERVLYNTLLGAKDTDGNGNYFYYSNYHALAQKGYYPQKWPCCSGTLVQGVADYPRNIYFHDADGLYVNLFTPSEVRWNMNGTSIHLVQQTEYPYRDSTALRVVAPTPIEFTLYVRIPAWISAAPQIFVNGGPISIRAEKGTFAAVHRTWKNNDVLEVTLPFAFRTEPVDDLHPETAALMRGPLMYVAATPPADLYSTPLRLPQGLRPLLGSSSIFEYPMAQTNLQFRPWYTIQNERYNTYFHLQKTDA